MIFKVVGVTFEGRQEVLKQLYGEHSGKATPGELVAEPENPYDPDAIAVYVDGKQIGYIGKPDIPLFQEYERRTDQLPDPVAVRINVEAVAVGWENISRFYATLAVNLD